MSLNSEAGKEADKQGETSRLFPVAVTGYSNGRSGGTGGLHDVEQPPQRSDFVDDGDRGLDRANDMRKAAAFGALDGVLLSFAVVAGAAGGGLSTSTVLIVGVSCIVAEALSMGLGEFLSSKAMNEYMALQRKRGEWQLGHNREEEIVSMVNSYILQGMSREDAEEVASRLSKYDSCFVNARMANEFGSYAAPVDDDDSLREGLVSFLSFTLSGCIPLLVYALSPVVESLHGGEAISRGTLFLLASLVTMVSLFFIGIIKASFVSRSWWNAAMETLVLGGCCAGLAYEIGAAMAILVKGMQ